MQFPSDELRVQCDYQGMLSMQTVKRRDIHFAKSMNKLSIAILAAVSLSLLGCDLFPESSFDLGRESRLPKWFTLPPGLSRMDVTVRMSYYIKHTGATATFILKDLKKGKKLAEASGTLKSLEPLTVNDPRSGLTPSYPSYEIITVNGVTEIIEHRRLEPIFYITDDPVVRSKLGLSSARF